MNNNSLGDFFKTNGVVIKDAVKFSKNYNEEEIKKVISDINSLNEDILEGVDVAGFLRDVTKKCDDITKLIKVDKNYSAGLNTFSNALDDFKKNFIIFNQYNDTYGMFLDAQKIYVRIDGVYQDLVSGYEKLNQDELTEEQKDKFTKTICEVGYNRKVAQKNKDKTEKLYLKKKRSLDESISKYKFKDYKKKLLADLEELKKNYDILNKEQKLMLDKDFSDLTRFINEFGNDVLKKETTLVELCSKYGLALEKSEEIALVINDAVASKNENVEPSVKAEKSRKAVGVDELVSDLEKLNPDVEFSLDGNKLNSSKPLDELEVPDYAKVKDNKIVVGNMDLEVVEKKKNLSSGSVHTDTKEQQKDDFQYPGVIPVETKTTNPEPVIPEPVVSDTHTQETHDEQIFHDPELDNEEEKHIPQKSEMYKRSIKQLVPFGLAGGAVGLLASTVVATPTITGLGVIRIGYSAVKFGNKMYSKYVLDGGDTKIDKVVKNFKNGVSEKYGDYKLYKAAKSINDFLKNPEVQWFLNGVAIGYTVGNVLDLKTKLDKALNPQKTVETTTIRESGTGTKRPEGTGATENIDAPTPEVPTPDLPTDTTVVSYPEIGQTYDLSSIEYGTRTAQDTINAVNQVNLLNENFETASIKLFKLADGSTYTGTLEDLVSSGVDLNTVAARIVNENGIDIAWMNAQDVMDAVNAGVTR